MPELQLKAIKNTDEGVIGKALSNFGKVIYSSGAGLFGIIINSKRNSLLKAYSNYENYTHIPDETKRNNVIAKYEKAYENYLNTLEKYILETIYTKVQKKVATISENRIMSNYYEINALKGNEYVEYKYKRQMLLLNMDFETILSKKNNSYIEKYKKFYIYTMEQIYKASMRHYAVILTDTKNTDETKYQKIYELIESYIKLVLPYCEATEENKQILEDYKKYIMTIDVYAKKQYNELKKNTMLLRLSRSLFTYSLPMVAAEQCYIRIIKECRAAIANSFIEADKYELYQLLLDVIEAYNIDSLCKKVYWDNPTKREEYNKFWERFQEIKKLERIDYDEYLKNREILFITYDLKMLKESKKKQEKIKEYYRERMIQLHGFRQLKNKYSIKNGKWKSRRRMPSD